MGFRDLKFFNQPLLARQAWCLIQFPNILCARLLKARYYPSGDLLDTAFIQNQSQTWQGILHRLDLLKHGIIWRIVNGSSIKIFCDNWIPRLDAMKLERRRNNTHRRWVSEFIDPTTRSWREALVHECCLPRDADAILAIKLPTRPCEDFVAWF
jgi:hypothetical protein